MSGTVALKRGAKPRGAPARRVARPVPQSARSSKKPSALAAAPEFVRRIVQWSLAVLILVAGIATIWLMGLPQQLAWETGEALGRTGFAVKNVEVTGVKRMARLPVYAAALDQPSNAMPLVDLDLIRERLLTQPWVADASVSRRLPDTIAIDIRERVPAVLWQNQGVVRLVDATGVVLQPVDPNQWPDLPLLVGPGANQQAGALMKLLDVAPVLKAEMSDAIWIGGRRWDIRFRSGETLALPEGDRAAEHALKLFARLDGAQGLLKRGFARFDMRLPDRMVIRVTNEPGGEAAPVSTSNNAMPI